MGKTKLDWFVDGKLKGVFNSYEHAAEILREELKNPRITEYCIRQIVKGSKTDMFRSINVYEDTKIIKTFANNTEFMDFYKICDRSKTCNVVNGKVKLKELNGYTIEVVNKIPDIRHHIYKETIEKRKCTCCEIEKPLTEEFFYNDSGKFRVRCKKCNLKVIGDKPIKTFLENVGDTWKNHPEFSNIYFERNTEQIFNIESGKYLTQESLINIINRLAKDLKWESFNGKIEKNMLVSFKNETDGFKLDNLICEYSYCKNCEDLIENPTLCNFYCSRRCLLDVKNYNEKHNRKLFITKYLSHKLSVHKNTNKKYNINIDYDVGHLLSLGSTCTYCGIDCKFGYGKENLHPDTLSFDKKNPDIGYCKENIVTCCWFCNRMKNQTKYEEWVQFINFIKNKDQLILDLSNKNFSRTSNEIRPSNIWYHVKEKSYGYYLELETAKYIFIDLCKTQNFLDPFFNFFPIVYLETNSLFNASIDAIDATLCEEEKYRPDNIQVVPKCFNYAKNILSNEDFLIEWNRRGFKTDFAGNSVKLPENYHTDSFFNRMIS
jgi:hypothetical protein